MEKSPAQILGATLENFQHSQKEIASLLDEQSASESKLADLCVNGDLKDEAVLDQISRLQVFTKLFPTRVESRRLEFNSRVNEMRDAILVFINHELFPRMRGLVNGFRAQATAKLKEHFTDESALSAAVEKSSIMNEVLALNRKVNFAKESSILLYNDDFEGLCRRAKSLLVLWGEMDAIEPKS